MPDQIISTENSFFGAEALENLIAAIKNNNFQRILIITNSNSKTASAKVSSLLAKNKTVYRIFNTTNVSATILDVKTAADTGKSFRADAIIAVGCKAVIDNAKAVSILLANQEITDPKKLGETTKLKNKPIPLYIVFSSIGNARDSSYIFILEDELKRRKIDCLCTKSLPKAVFFTSNLMDPISPADFSISTLGLLAASIESFVCKKSWSISDAFALKAVNLISENIFSAAKGNSKAREQILAAQYFSGIAAGNSGAALGTAISESLEAFSGIQASGTSALLLPEIMRFNAPSTGTKYRDIAIAMGAKISSSAAPESFRKTAVNTVEKLIKKLSLPKKTLELNVTKEDITFIQESILKNRYTELNPKTVTKKKIMDFINFLS